MADGNKKTDYPLPSTYHLLIPKSTYMVYSFGGQYSGYSWGQTDNVYKYNRLADKWIEVNRMPWTGYAFTGVKITYKGRNVVLIYGGCCYDDPRMAAFDLEDEQWEELTGPGQIPSAPVIRSGFAFTIGPRAYLLRGSTASRNESTVLQVFNTMTDTWDESQLPESGVRIQSVYCVLMKAEVISVRP